MSKVINSVDTVICVVEKSYQQRYCTVHITIKINGALLPIEIFTQH